jgi:hypothetical protein
MSDALERSIREQRDEFDQDMPGSHVWDHIEKGLPLKKKTNITHTIRLLRWTAAAILLLGLTIGMTRWFGTGTDIPDEHGEKYEVNTTTGNEPMDIAEVRDSSIIRIDPVFAARLANTSSDITRKQTEIRNFAKDDPELYKRFHTDLSVLDSSYRSLRNILEDNPNKEQLIEAMSRNLQMQLLLLERQLDILKLSNKNQKRKI